MIERMFCKEKVPQVGNGSKENEITTLEGHAYSYI